jgi:hypothetical protein
LAIGDYNILSALPEGRGRSIGLAPHSGDAVYRLVLKPHKVRMKTYRCLFYHTHGRTTLEIKADDGRSAAIAAVSTLAALHYERVEVWDETGLVVTRDTPILRATVDIVVAPAVEAATGTRRQEKAK